MGLRQLEWHQGNRGAWTARINYGNQKYRRFADVNAINWTVRTARRSRKGEVPVEFTALLDGEGITWHDSIEAAKLYVEAIFALDN
jgi:hypothetical protein